MDNELSQPIPQSPEVISPEPITKPPTKFPIVAVLAGLLVLVGVGSGLYFFSRPKPPVAMAPVQKIPESTPVPQITLNLSSPSVDTVATGDSLTVAGTTLPNISVAVFTDNHDIALQSDDTGHFSGQIPLDSGVSTLTVTAFGSDGQEKTLTQDVVFDDQVLGKSTVALDHSNSASSKDKKFVEATIDSIKLSHQIDKTTNIVDERNKPLKTDLSKIKDRVIAIFSDDDSTKSGSLKKILKIVVKNATDSAQIRTSKRRAVQGVVSSISGGIITLSHQTQLSRQVKVITSDQTVVMSHSASTSASLKASAIQVGTRIIAFGTPNSTGDLVANRIYIIPGQGLGLKIPTGSPSATPPVVSVTPSIAPSITATPSATIAPTAAPTTEPSPTP